MKYVYVVTGSSQNVYVEQSWVSAWSLRHYNPKAEICFITDVNTKSYIEKEKKSCVQLIPSGRWPSS